MAKSMFNAPQARRQFSEGQKSKGILDDYKETKALFMPLNEGSILYAGDRGQINQDNSNLFWDDTNKRLGIGTNAPAMALDVHSTGANFRFNHTGTLTNIGMILARAGVTKSMISHNSSNDNLEFYHGASLINPRMVIDDDGNVGIGTDSPNEQLELTGNIRIPKCETSTEGIILKDNEPYIHDYTPENVDGKNLFIGEDCGNFTMARNTVTTDASKNIGIGNQALNNLTYGFRNIGIGERALRDVTSGNSNTAIGALAAINITEGIHNFALGRDALNFLTTGDRNTAIGNQAMQYNVTGGNNIAIGFQALRGTNGNANSSGNLCIGYQAGKSLNTNANNNIYIGFEAGETATTGQKNVIIGYEAEPSSVTASNELNIGNIIFGKIDTGEVGIGTATPLYSLDTDEVGNSTGDLKLEPDVHGNVTLFEDTDVGDEENSKALILHRKAEEGDTNLKIDISKTKVARFTSAQSMNFAGNLLYFFPNGGSAIFGRNWASGQNDVFRHQGWITAAASSKWIKYQVNDITDNYELTRQDANILGFDIQMPLMITDGEVTLNGTARVTKTQEISLSSMKKGVGSPPADGLKDGFPTLDFDDSTEEEVFFDFIAPSDMDLTADMGMHIMFFVDTAPASAKGVVWGIEWKNIATGEKLDFTSGTATITDTCAVTTGTPANDSVIINCEGLTGGGGTISAGDLLQMRLFRDATNGSDTFVGDARLIEAHVHYTANKLGAAT